jgi:hypothetical protein
MITTDGFKLYQSTYFSIKGIFSAPLMKGRLSS